LKARGDSVFAASSEKLEAAFTTCCEVISDVSAVVPASLSTKSLDDLARSANIPDARVAPFRNLVALATSVAALRSSAQEGSRAASAAEGKTKEGEQIRYLKIISNNLVVLADSVEHPFEPGSPFGASNIPDASRLAAKSALEKAAELHLSVMAALVKPNLDKLRKVLKEMETIFEGAPCPVKSEKSFCEYLTKKATSSFTIADLQKRTEKTRDDLQQLVRKCGWHKYLEQYEAELTASAEDLIEVAAVTVAMNAAIVLMRNPSIKEPSSGAKLREHLGSIVLKYGSDGRNHTMPEEIVQEARKVLGSSPSLPSSGAPASSQAPKGKRAAAKSEEGVAPASKRVKGASQQAAAATQPPKPRARASADAKDEAGQPKRVRKSS